MTMSEIPNLASFRTSPLFLQDTSTTNIYTLSLHDALPIYLSFNELDQPTIDALPAGQLVERQVTNAGVDGEVELTEKISLRSEEHTSELQSRLHLVCRLLLEKKKEEEYTIESRTHKSAQQS